MQDNGRQDLEKAGKRNTSRARVRQKPQRTKKQTEIPQGGQKPQSAKRQKHPAGAEASGRHKTNTNSSDQHQRTIANHIHQEEEKHNERAGPTRQQNKRHPTTRRNPRAPKGRLQPQSGTNTNYVHRYDQTALRKPRESKCSAANASLSLLHQDGRGDGVCRWEMNPYKPLALPSASTPSHEVSPSQMGENQGGGSDA